MSTLPFHHLILLEPLGLLFGSRGRILSPEALTGRAAEHFPPDSPAFAGLLAAQLDRASVRDLHTAGPFWSTAAAPSAEAPAQLMLPAPLTLLQVEEQAGGCRVSCRRLSWQEGDGADLPRGWRPSDGNEPPRKSPSGGWVALNDWPLLGSNEAVKVHPDPWEPVPHLHPRLRDDERVSAGDGALFLEYGIALRPGVALAYLSSHAIADGVARFGGEGHLVNLRCQPMPPELVRLLEQPLAAPFGLITPGLWGGPKLSLREPVMAPNGQHPWHRGGVAPGILTDKPRPWRHRLGAGPTRGGGSQGRRRLSRGRWAMPAGSCYQVAGEPLPPWAAWPESWFPREGFSFRQLGTGLALPLA